MNFIGNKLRILAIATIALLVSVIPSLATDRTFSTGSYIISADSCWQPNGDTKNTTNAIGCDTNTNDQSIFQVYGLLYALLDTGDQPDKCENNDGSMPQQKAMLGYCKQVKVYWVIKADKASPHDVDLQLTTIDTAINPIVSIYNSAKTGAGNSTQAVNYRGGPFVIDANGITDAEFATIKTKFPAVKIHKANIGFSGNVDKVLIGKPPKIGVLSEGNSDVLEDYIRAAGQFAWKGVVFQYVGARDIIAGCLQDPIPATCLARNATKANANKITVPFQLLWAPHWEIENKWTGESTTPSAADQTSVVAEIRAFLERGNSGFFECASIGSLEASHSVTDIGMSVSAGTGGFLVSNTKTVPRLEVNKGCFKGYNNPNSKDCTSNYIVPEAVPFWLTQCGGWDYKPTSGLIDSMRPVYNTTTPANSYTYLTTKMANDSGTTVDDRYVGTQMTRFLHDDSTKLNTAYTDGTDHYHVYDYLVGGRINGSPTQGYLIYFPGHKYISCKNSTTFAYPPSRTLEISFDAITPVKDPLLSGIVPENSIIYAEIVHANCTQGSTCPKISYNLTTKSGTRSADTWVDASAEFATYNTVTNKLEGVFFTSAFAEATLTSLLVSDIYVTYDSNTNNTKLSSIVDVTDASATITLCTPPSPGDSTTPSSVTVNCSSSGVVPNSINLQFDGNVDVGTRLINITAKTSTGSAVGTYDLSTNTGSGATSAGGVTLDLSTASYDALAFTLKNVKMYPTASCAAVSLTDFSADFPGGSTKLTQVTNTTTSKTLCSPGVTSPASCTSVAATSSAGTITIATELQFKERYVDDYLKNTASDSEITLSIKYSCGSGCSGTVSNKYKPKTTNTGNPTGNLTDTDTYLRIDSRTAYFGTGDNRYILKDIFLTNKNSSKTVTITEVSVTFADHKEGSIFTTQKLYKLRDTTNNADIVSDSNGKASVASWTGKSYEIKNGSSGGGSTTWSYSMSAGTCNYYLGPYLSYCDINWSGSNTCGVKYVLNTFLALKYQSTTAEFSKTQPLLKDGIVYSSSFDYPSYRGHLKMKKLPTGSQTATTLVWDAASAMPTAGTSGFPSAPLSSTDTSSPRYIFTNLPDAVPDSSTGFITPIKFDPVSFAALDSTTKASFKTAIQASSDNDAKVTINTVRGRKNASTQDIYTGTANCSTGTADGTIDTDGCAEDSKRLWAIENSTPVLKVKSKHIEATTTTAITTGRDRRDRFLFVGADDGMLHAFWAGSFNATTQSYPDTASGKGTGKETWAYIPSALLSNLKNQPFNPDPANESSFEPKVKVDGSPAMNDFLYCAAKDLVGNCSSWKWRTILVGTATDNTVNKGIVFALDVSDPYSPKIMWEKTYNKTSDSTCKGTSRNCNMGYSKGVAIGTAQIGTEMKDYVFLTSSWIYKKKAIVDGSGKTTGYSLCTTDTTGCTFGISGYALDIFTGDVKWETSLPYTADSVNINDPPASPALMDRDNNGTVDYAIFGDMQGRLWALRTTDGTNLTGANPVYQIKKLDATTGKDTTVNANSSEPIAAPVAISKDLIVLATGGADYALDTQKYRVEVVRLSNTGATKDKDSSGNDMMTVITDAGEKIWAQPAIANNNKVLIGTAKSYYSNQTVSSLQSTGRIIQINLRETRAAGTTSNVKYAGGTNTADQWFTGGFVGGFDLDKGQAVIGTLKPSKDSSGTTTDMILLGEISTTSGATGKVNPYKILWWRKL